MDEEASWDDWPYYYDDGSYDGPYDGQGRGESYEGERGAAIPPATADRRAGGAGGDFAVATHADGGRGDWAVRPPGRPKAFAEPLVFVGIKIPASMAAAIDALGRTRSDVVRAALSEYLDR